MLTDLVAGFITKEEKASGEVIVNRGSNVLTISTDKGTLGIREDGENYKLILFSLDEEEVRAVCDGGNKLMKEWYNASQKSKGLDGKYEKLPPLMTLPLGAADEISFYILSRILPRADNHCMN